MKVLGTQHCVVVSKKKTLVNFFPLWQFTTFYKWFFFMSVQEKTEPSSWQEEDSWHCIWLTSHNADCNGKVFFFATMSTAQHFFCPPPINSLSLPHSHFRSLFYLHISAMSGVSRGRKGVSPTDCCVLSQPRAESIASHSPSPPSSFIPSPSTGALICASLLFVWKMWLWRQHQDPSLPPQHHNMLITTC